MLIRFCIMIGMLILPISLYAQLPNGSFEADRLPWSSAYMASTLDQFVHGEQYRGYPGPLVKMFDVLGLGTNNPAIDTELLAHVDRNAPNWFGICNGWAVASMTFDEPDEVVIRGVKFFPGDLKAIVSGVYKSNSAVFLSETDQVFGGMTPDSFESVLKSRIIDERAPVIFDEDYTSEVWNYPVFGFDRSSTVNGEFTEVTTRVYYGSLVSMDQADVTGVPLLNPVDYTYRYHTATNSQYTWIGESEINHPAIAWLMVTPYIQGAWLMLANHHYDLTHYQRLLALANEPGNKIDRFEPNETMDAAHAMKGGEYLMGSLLPGDVDYFMLPLGAGGRVDLNFKVYDGNPIDLAIFTADGTELFAQASVADLDLGTLIEQGQWSGDLRVRLTPNADFADKDAYYQLMFSEDTSSFDSRSGETGNLNVVAINTRDAELNLDGSALDQAQTVAPWGSSSVENLPAGKSLRADQRTVWAETETGTFGVRKKYHRDHQRSMPYRVGHLTFRGGWTTHLDIRSENTNATVTIDVFADDGVLLQSANLPLTDSKFSGSLANVLNNDARRYGAWFELKTDTSNALDGVAAFVNGAGIPLRVDIQSNPTIGEAVIFDLKSRYQGGTGVSVVNAADVENEVQYRVIDPSGDIIANGFLSLKPGARWLASVATLSPEILTGEHLFYLHSQYPIETVVVQIQRNPNLLYAHRAMSTQIDPVSETYITLPADRSQSHLLFANLSSANARPFFRGYDASGFLHGEFNIDIDKPLAPGETRLVPLTQVLQEGVRITDVDAITHFRITSAQPVYALEFVGSLESGAPMAVRFPIVYENP